MEKGEAQRAKNMSHFKHSQQPLDAEYHYTQYSHTLLMHDSTRDNCECNIDVHARHLDSCMNGKSMLFKCYFHCESKIFTFLIQITRDVGDSGNAFKFFNHQACHKNGYLSLTR